MRYFTFKKWIKHHKLIESIKQLRKKYRKHPERFMENYFGIKLHWYQKLMLKCVERKYL